MWENTRDEIFFFNFDDKYKFSKNILSVHILMPSVYVNRLPHACSIMWTEKKHTCNSHVTFFFYILHILVEMGWITAYKNEKCESVKYILVHIKLNIYVLMMGALRQNVLILLNSQHLFFMIYLLFLDDAICIIWTFNIPSMSGISFLFERLLRYIRLTQHFWNDE